MSSSHWYAIIVRPRSEKAVAQVLTQKGIETYLPIYRCEYRSSGRFKAADLPLFPHYVFCRTELSSRVTVLATPGVYRFVGFGNTIPEVDPNEISALRVAEGSGVRMEPWPFLNTGDLVRIHEGPLAGLVGRIVGPKGSARLILNVSLLQRSVAVEVSRCCVTAA